MYQVVEKMNFYPKGPMKHKNPMPGNFKSRDLLESIGCRFCLSFWELYSMKTAYGFERIRDSRLDFFDWYG